MHTSVCPYELELRVSQCGRRHAGTWDSSPRIRAGLRATGSSIRFEVNAEGHVPPPPFFAANVRKTTRAAPRGFSRILF